MNNTLIGGKQKIIIGLFFLTAAKLLYIIKCLFGCHKHVMKSTLIGGKQKIIIGLFFLTAAKLVLLYFIKCTFDCQNRTICGVYYHIFLRFGGLQ